MDTNKSFLIMVVLSAVLIVMMFFFNKNGNNNTNANNTAVTQNVESSKQQSSASFNEKKTAAANTGLYDLLEEKPQTNNYDLVYDNKNIKIIFDPNDAVIKHAWVKYIFLDNSKDKSTDLVQPLKADDASLRMKFGSWDSDITLSSLTGGKNFYNYEKSGNDTFIFNASIKKKDENLIYYLTKKFTFLKDSNIFKLEIEITNNKNQPINFDNTHKAFSIGWGPALGIDNRIYESSSNQKNQQNYLVYLKGNKEITKIENKSDKELFKLVRKDDNDGWVASDSHYFAALIYPDDNFYDYFFDFRDYKNKNYYAGFSRNTQEYLSHINSTFYVYIGPKISSVLKNYDNVKEFNLKNTYISKVEDNIMFGLGNYIGDLLEFIYRLVKNYGIAIIILTILIKLLLSPLTHKSMVSQQKMSKLQPKIKELQERYKGNPQQLNKETMDLYKREKINPFGGCLPMLLQLPILYAMYYLLNSMVQLKGASFLWMNDLSMPDAIINFHKEIPLVFFSINSFNLLPFIMTVVQVGSSLLTQDGQANKQATIMIWSMTIFMFVIFYNSSSGLVLYWTVMNILNLIQQFYVVKMKKKKAIVV